MSGRYAENTDFLTHEADDFVIQMQARLENLQKIDFIEALDDQVKELEVKLNEIIGKQVVAMREAAMEQNENLKEAIYCAFIEKETVKGDVVEFKTTFGVTLTTVGNRRTLNSFRGFKRCNMDGTVEYVDAPYKVYGFSIQYRRYLTMAAKRERKDAV